MKKLICLLVVTLLLSSLTPVACADAPDTMMDELSMILQFDGYGDSLLESIHYYDPMLRSGEITASFAQLNRFYSDYYCQSVLRLQDQSEMETAIDGFIESFRTRFHSIDFSQVTDSNALWADFLYNHTAIEDMLQYSTQCDAQIAEFLLWLSDDAFPKFAAELSYVSGNPDRIAVCDSCAREARIIASILTDATQSIVPLVSAGSGEANELYDLSQDSLMLYEYCRTKDIVNICEYINNNIGYLVLFAEYDITNAIDSEKNNLQGDYTDEIIVLTRSLNSTLYWMYIRDILSKDDFVAIMDSFPVTVSMTINEVNDLGKEIGFMEDDVLLAVDGIRTTSLEIVSIMNWRLAMSGCNVTVLRDGKPQSLLLKENNGDLGVEDFQYTFICKDEGYLGFEPTCKVVPLP